ncbi:tol-pal system protein YbgF [Pontibacterium granulatum]|uniref:tol-pal system protein YbgF n=1 Tax=Pontibacterium granulatum TaxID=2036029 RepID=UPI00249C884C|nr:tol-pal system protein YbgF [Pontibacterium granulatum]MDI3326038.1 tol-pal system protein YbgF [Pontibacterium granulatum]
MSSVRRFSTIALALSFSAGAMAASPPVIEIRTDDEPVLAQGNLAAQPSAASGNAQLLMIIQQLQDEVRSLRGELEQQAFRIKKMEGQQLDRYRDLDRRISALMSNSGASAASSKPPVAALSEQSGGVTPSGFESTAPQPEPQTTTDSAGAVSAVQSQVKPAQPASSVKNGVSDSKAYRDAFALVRARDFAGAVVAFNAFVRDYPNSPRVANAHYWMGEIHHAEQELELARESFALVLGQFPDHPKAPHAAYKLGVIYSELGDKARSDEYLDYVLKNHPKSNVAPLVEEFKRQ